MRSSTLWALLVVGAALSCGGSGSGKGTSDQGKESVLDVAESKSPELGPSDSGGSHEPELASIDAFDEAEQESDIAASQAPKPLKGPYLQMVSGEGVVVMVEVEEPVDGAAVLVGRQGEPKNSKFKFDFQPIETEFLPPPGTFLGRAVVAGLEPATRYEYCLQGLDAPCGSFFTAPKEKAPSSFRFVVFGDHRTNPEDHATVVQAVQQDEPMFLVDTGDLVESGASLEQWQDFFSIQEYLLRNAPFYPTIGNHDVIIEPGDEYYLSYFELPAPLGDERNYYFTYGSAAFVVLDSERDLTIPPLLDWLDSVLQELEAEGYAFKFVALHRPIFTFGLHPEYFGDGGKGYEVLHPLFVKYGVAAVFQGHNHMYEHFLVDGVHYFTVGGGGAPLYEANSNVIEEQKDFLVMASSVLSHVVVEIDGEVARITAYNDEAGRTDMDYTEIVASTVLPR